jgi:hypothetical protein
VEVKETPSWPVEQLTASESNTMRSCHYYSRVVEIFDEARCASLSKRVPGGHHWLFRNTVKKQAVKVVFTSGPNRFR